MGYRLVQAAGRGLACLGPVSGLLSDRFDSRLSLPTVAVFGAALVGWMCSPVIPLLGLRRADRGEPDRLRHVRRTELLLHHGARAGPAARRGVRDAFTPPELRHRPVDRRIFFALMIAVLAGGLTVTLTAGLHRQASRWPSLIRLGPCRRCRSPVRRGPGREPGAAPAAAADALASPGREPARPDRSGVLPRSDLRAVPPGADRGVRRGHRPFGAGRARLAAARHPPGRARERPSVPSRGRAGAARCHRPRLRLRPHRHRPRPGTRSHRHGLRPGVTASGPTVSGPGPAPAPPSRPHRPRRHRLRPHRSGPAASGPTASGPTASGPTASGPTVTGRKRNSQ